MEMCYNNSSSSSASVDSSNNHLMMGRQTRYCPISVNSIVGPTFSPCVRPQSALDVVDSTPTALLRGYSRPSSAEAYLSPLMDSGQLIHRHLRSLSSSRGSSPSPLTPIENLPTPPSRSPPVYKATPPPVKLAEGEDVLVMDGILVNSSSPSGVNRGSTLRPSIDSSGSSSNNGLYKTEICRSWEDSGTCRYGTKCQFAHGKEELRPARHPRYKSETCKSFSATGTCMFGTKCRYVHQAPPEEEVATPVKTEAEEMVAAALQVGTDAADAYINRVLYGPRRIRRLPVFEDCCPE